MTLLNSPALEATDTPVANAYIVHIDEQAKFAELADRWEDETVLLSSMEEATRHPAYREIVAMGEKAIRPILERMNESRGHWFLPLLEITGENPVEHTDRGNIDAMESAWQKWGQQRGYHLNGNQRY